MHQWLPRSSSPSLASSEPTRRLGGTRPAQALASLLDLAGAVESDFATLELKAAGEVALVPRPPSRGIGRQGHMGRFGPGCSGLKAGADEACAGSCGSLHGAFGLTC